MATPQMPKVLCEIIHPKGGLDLITPTLSLPPGVARDSVNFEASITGGYSRIAGYERFDGRPSPAGATYSSLTVAITGAIAVGNTITGGTSAATGVVIAIDGSTVIYTKGSGTFTVAETVKVGGTSQGTVTTLGTVTGPSDRTAATYLYLAGEAYRSDIQAVPGSGPIRGVAYYGGIVYAWRNNAGGTALAIYKSSAGGWVSCPLGYELTFSTGTAALAEGNTVTGFTSGATGVVKRIVLESGTYGASTAAGRLIFAAVTGTFQAGELIKIGGTSYCTATAAQSAITLSPGGRIEASLANFGAGQRIYGVDGVNRAFEFDGTVYVPIKSGMTTDAPNHMATHKYHLFLAFGNSVQFSGLGAPYQFTPITGAGEIAMDAPVTGMIVQTGDQSTGALAIYCDELTSILYGSSSANFSLVPYNIGTGAKAYSLQNLDSGYYFSDRGVMSLVATLRYGNFETASLTMNIRPFIQSHRTIVTDTVLSRERAQYRVFFSDGAGLYVTVGSGKYMGAMPVQFPNPVSVICEGVASTGAETCFFGSTNGYVYQLDVGTSFDGAEIAANMTLVFNSIRSPRILKRYRKASVEVSGNGYSEFVFGYDLGYATTDLSQPTEVSYANNLIASYWDSASWDSFVWDGRTLAPSEVEVVGTAENIAVRISSNSYLYQPFTINSIILHYSMRRGMR